ncbi:MAG: thymidine phosphorylase [Clostridiales bacterium]|nr:thymidine phosphorylase [Clostridiales bacterium]
MRMTDLIGKKKRGGELTDEEIAFFVNGYTRGEIPDYQASAFCMAVCFRGMSARECAALTEAMARSGDMIDLSRLSHTADKHSTGGVGDLTTLVTVPIAAAGGLSVAKMSGGGLGHSGGTVDKLESVPGVRTALSEEEFLSQVKRIGAAVAGQTADLAPADKKLYALRDVTETVDSIPLIASSIMSKKLAAGAESIVLDVKYGSGAFMKTPEDAQALARTMTEIGRAHGRRMAALVTSMEFPLAPQIGNSLEVEQAVRILRGEDPRGYGIRTIAVRLAGEMFSLSLGISSEEGVSRAEDLLASGKAYGKFLEWIAAQGGDVSYIGEDRFERAPHARTVLSPAAGYVTKADTEAVGMAACVLGAGRMKKEDSPDLSAGLTLAFAPFDRVEKDQPLAVLYTSDPGTLDAAQKLLTDALTIAEEPAEPEPLIWGVIR